MELRSHLTWKRDDQELPDMARLSLHEPNIGSQTIASEATPSDQSSPLGGSPVYRVPFEIWQTIFSLATKFHDFDAPSIADIWEDRLQAWRTSLRMRKHIVRVCRAWRASGRPFLFEHIVLISIPHLARIVQILEAATDPKDSVGVWTRSVCLAFTVPIHWRKLYEGHVVRLVKRCPNMTRYLHRVVDAGLNLGVYRAMPRELEEALVEHGRVPLRVLDLMGDELMSFPGFFAVSRGLFWLSIPGFGTSPTEGRDGEAEPTAIDMPFLTHLDINGLVRPSTGCTVHSVLPIGVSYTVPHLHSLRFQQMYNRLRVDEGDLLFISQHGTRIESLNFLEMGTGHWDQKWLPLPFILKECPYLREIVCRASHLELENGDGEQLLHSSLADIILCHVSSDLGRGMRDLWGLRDLFEFLTPTSFPGLQRIRIASIPPLTASPLGTTPELSEDELESFRNVDTSKLSTTKCRAVEFWVKWILEWTGRGVRLANAAGDPLRLGDLTMEGFAGYGDESDDESEYQEDEVDGADDADEQQDADGEPEVDGEQEVKGEQEADQSGQNDAQEEVWVGPRTASPSSNPSASLHSYHPSDAGHYIYSVQPDVELHDSEEDEDADAWDPCQEDQSDIDEESALEIFERVVNDVDFN